MRNTLAMLVLGCVCWAGFGSTAAEEKGKVSKPFNGQDLTGWKFKGDPKKSTVVVGWALLDEKNPSKLQVTPLKAGEETGSKIPELVNAKTGVDFYTEEKWGDCTVEVEFMVPKGSNSGIYLMGEYEVQILDSYGRAKVGPGDLGGLYGASAPKVNASKKPGEWQKFVIDFQAPKFADGKKVSNAKFLKVVLNDQVIHENVEMKGQTPGGVTGKEVPTGPLMFQGNHGPVSFRNIRVLAK